MAKMAMMVAAVCCVQLVTAVKISTFKMDNQFLEDKVDPTFVSQQKDNSHAKKPGSTASQSIDGNSPRDQAGLLVSDQIPSAKNGPTAQQQEYARISFPIKLDGEVKEADELFGQDNRVRDVAHIQQLNEAFETSSWNADRAKGALYPQTFIAVLKESYWQKFIKAQEDEKVKEVKEDESSKNLFFVDHVAGQPQTHRFADKFGPFVFAVTIEVLDHDQMKLVLTDNVTHTIQKKDLDDSVLLYNHPYEITNPDRTALMRKEFLSGDEAIRKAGLLLYRSHALTLFNAKGRSYESQHAYVVERFFDLGNITDERLRGDLSEYLGGVMTEDMDGLIRGSTPSDESDNHWHVFFNKLNTDIAPGYPEHLGTDAELYFAQVVQQLFSNGWAFYDKIEFASYQSFVKSFNEAKDKKQYVRFLLEYMFRKFGSYECEFEGQASKLAEQLRDGQRENIGKFLNDQLIQLRKDQQTLFGLIKSGRTTHFKIQAMIDKDPVLINFPDEDGVTAARYAVLGREAGDNRHECLLPLFVVANKHQIPLDFGVRSANDDLENGEQALCNNLFNDHLKQLRLSQEELLPFIESGNADEIKKMIQDNPVLLNFPFDVTQITTKFENRSDPVLRDFTDKDVFTPALVAVLLGQPEVLMSLSHISNESETNLNFGQTSRPLSSFVQNILADLDLKVQGVDSVDGVDAACRLRYLKVFQLLFFEPISVEGNDKFGYIITIPKLTKYYAPTVNALVDLKKAVKKATHTIIATGMFSTDESKILGFVNKKCQQHSKYSVDARIAFAEWLHKQKSVNVASQEHGVVENINNHNYY